MAQPSLLNKVENAADVDLSILKVAGFVGIVVLFAWISGYFIATINPVYGILSLSIFWILFSLQVLFLKGWRRISLAVLVECAAITMPTAVILRENLNWYMLLGLGVLYLLLISAESFGRKEISNSLKIPFFKVTQGVLGRVIPSTFIFISFVYIFLIGVSVLDDRAKFLAGDLPVAVASIIQENPSVNISAKGLLDEVIKLQIGEEKFKTLPAGALAQAYGETERLIEGYAGSAINMNEPVVLTVYGIFKNIIDKSDILGKLVLILSVFITIWFTAKTLVYVLYIPLTTVAFVLYETLIVTNFIVIQYETRSREIILLK